MTEFEIKEKVRKILVEDIEIDEAKIKPEARLKEDLGIDSLDYVDIVVLVDNEFGFKIRQEEMASVKTYGDFCAYISTKLS